MTQPLQKGFRAHQHLTTSNHVTWQISWSFHITETIQILVQAFQSIKSYNTSWNSPLRQNSFSKNSCTKKISFSKAIVEIDFLTSGNFMRVEWNLLWAVTPLNDPLIFITVRIRRMREGNVFTGVCLSTGGRVGGGGGTPGQDRVSLPPPPPQSGQRFPSLPQPGQGYPSTSLPTIPPCQDRIPPSPHPYRTGLGRLCGAGDMPLAFTQTWSRYGQDVSENSMWSSPPLLVEYRQTDTRTLHWNYYLTAYAYGNGQPSKVFLCKKRDILCTPTSRARVQMIKHLVWFSLVQVVLRN